MDDVKKFLSGQSSFATAPQSQQSFKIDNSNVSSFLQGGIGNLSDVSIFLDPEDKRIKINAPQWFIDSSEFKKEILPYFEQLKGSSLDDTNLQRLLSSDTLNLINTQAKETLKMVEARYELKNELKQYIPNITDDAAQYALYNIANSSRSDDDETTRIITGTNDDGSVITRSLKDVVDQFKNFNDTQKGTQLKQWEDILTDDKYSPEDKAIAYGLIQFVQQKNLATASAGTQLDLGINQFFGNFANSAVGRILSAPIEGVQLLTGGDGTTLRDQAARDVSEDPRSALNSGGLQTALATSGELAGLAGDIALTLPVGGAAVGGVRALTGIGSKIASNILPKASSISSQTTTELASRSPGISRFLTRTAEEVPSNLAFGVSQAVTQDDYDFSNNFLLDTAIGAGALGAARVVKSAVQGVEGAVAANTRLAKINDQISRGIFSAATAIKDIPLLGRIIKGIGENVISGTAKAERGLTRAYAAGKITQDELRTGLNTIKASVNGSAKLTENVLQKSESFRQMYDLNNILQKSGRSKSAIDYTVNRTLLDRIDAGQITATPQQREVIEDIIAQTDSPQARRYYEQAAALNNEITQIGQQYGILDEDIIRMMEESPEFADNYIHLQFDINSRSPYTGRKTATRNQKNAKPVRRLKGMVTDREGVDPMLTAVDRLAALNNIKLQNDVMLLFKNLGLAEVVDDATYIGARNRLRSIVQNAKTVVTRSIDDTPTDDLLRGVEDIEDPLGNGFDLITERIDNYIDDLVQDVISDPQFDSVISRLDTEGVDNIDVAVEALDTYKKQITDKVEKLLQGTELGADGRRAITDLLEQRIENRVNKTVSDEFTNSNNEIQKIQEEIEKLQKTDTNNVSNFNDNIRSDVYKRENLSLYRGTNDVNLSQTNPDRPIYYADNPEYAATYGDVSNKNVTANVIEANNIHAYEQVANELGKVIDKYADINKLSGYELGEIRSWLNRTLEGDRLSQQFNKPMPEAIKQAFQEIGVDYIRIPGGQFPGTTTLADGTSIGHQTEIIEIPKPMNSGSRLSSKTQREISILTERIERLRNGKYIQSNISSALSDNAAEIKRLNAEINSPVSADDVGIRTADYFENGGRGKLSFNDPDVADYFTSNFAVPETGMVWQALIGASRAFRAGTTGLNPIFNLVINPIRDITRSAITTGGSVLTPRNVVRTLIESAGMTPQQANDFYRLAQEARKNSLWNSTSLTFARNEPSRAMQYRDLKRLDAQFSRAEGDKGAIAINIANPKNAVRNIENVFNGVDKEGIRRNVFDAVLERSIRAGKTPEQALSDAVFYADEATTSFWRAGKHARSFVRAVPYLSAAINGQASFARLWALDPVGVTARLASGIVAPTVFLTLNNLNNEDYKNIPNYVKDTNFIIMQPDGTYIKIPMDYDLARIVNPFRDVIEGLHDSDLNAFNLISDAVLNGSPIDMSGFTDRDFQGNVDVGRALTRTAASLLPQGVQAAYEATTGRDLYTGNALGPTDAELYSRGAEGELTNADRTYDSRNSQVLGFIANLTGIPQYTIQNIVSNLTGQVGDFVVNALDKATGADESAQGGRDIVENLGNRLSGDATTGGNKSTAYYDITDTIEKEREDTIARLSTYGLTDEQKQQITDEYSVDVAELVNTYTDEFGELDGYRLSQIINLLSLDDSVNPYAEGDVRGEPIRQAQQDARTDAERRAFDLGIQTSTEQNRLGRIFNNNGQDSWDFSDVSTIPGLIQENAYGAPRQVAYDFAQIVGADRDTGAASLRDEMQTYYTELDKLYDKAKGLKGKAASAVYDEINALQEQYMTQVFDRRIKPLIDKYGPSALDNSQVLQEISSLIMVPGDYTPFQSRKKQPYLTDDTKAYILDRYGVGRINEVNRPSDAEATALINAINSDLDAGRRGAASTKLTNLQKQLNAGKIYVSRDNMETIRQLIEIANSR